MIAAIAVVVVLAIVGARSAQSRRRTGRLKERFGPEYERTVGGADGQKDAEAELEARERKRERLDIVPLSPEAQKKYSDNWRTVQTAFVDNPSSAVGDADHLVTEVMRERGYPIDDFDQRAADISVDHPGVVENYREAHSIYVSQKSGDVGTEEQRRAFVHYRALFDELLENGKVTERQEART